MSVVPKIIAHLDMDAFFAAVEQRDHPRLKGRPVIIGADPKQGQGRGVVSTCSYEARTYGIHSAMPIAQAYRRCPQGVFLRGDMAKYSAVSRQIFAILQAFTPTVQPVSIDEAFLDITGSTHFFRSPSAMGSAIKQQIKKELGLNASIGIAPIKMAAKMASDYCKPDGLLVILPEQLLDFLWPLPVGTIWGVGRQTQKALQAMDIMTIGTLAAVSREQLTRRFGVHGAHLHDLANGIDEREVVVDDDIKSISHEHTFDKDTRQREAVYTVLAHLSEKVSRRLRKAHLQGRTVTLKVRLSGFHTYTRSCTLPERVNFYDDICKTGRALFDAFYRPNMVFRLIGIRVSHFGDPYVSDSLFTDAVKERNEKVHQAVDVIKDKFGEHAIQRGAIT